MFGTLCVAETADMDRWLTDNDPDPRWPLHTRANVGEVFPLPVTPLTWTYVALTCYEPAYRDAVVRMGALDHDEFGPGPVFINSFGGYSYLNASVFRVLAVRAPGMAVDHIDRLYFGEDPSIPPYEPHPDDESPEHSERIGRTMAEILATSSLPELHADKEHVAMARASRPPFAAMPGLEIVEWARALQPELRRLFEQHVFISGAASTPIGVIQAVCAEIGDPTLALRLVSGIGDVDSAAPSRWMWRLSRDVSASASLTAEFDAGVDGLVRRLGKTDEGAAFLASLDELLYEHGSRGPNEWEWTSTSWEVEPELVLAAVDRMRGAGDELDPDLQTVRMAAERGAIAVELDNALAGAPEARAQLEAALRSAQVFVAGRERTKTTIVRLINEYRMAFRELGRRGVDAGAIESPTSLAMLTFDQLEQFVANPMSMAAVIGEREADYVTLFDLEPPFIVNGEVPPLSTWRRRGESAVEIAATGTTLTGVPGCPGTATGRARVVLDPADPRGIEPGDVLIAPITDPAWTPLFVPAAAVVVEVGAPLSHAVIVSRELGIPCVVSVKDATRRIPDGALVEVDGTTGTVRVVG